ncbi:hypothetical protein [Butyrivibrio sp. INlla16]|uniref:hypothetical protein n=1 Tax=Butyrivibrio sp. INlla16 TaxID=1520807 RepID=UPI000883059C|nr:hypothetical protein [Butyrivibrio sp. INlla16]SDB54032.1 hypothetical protein SAMN02910263_02735 [Butyrivibrio sp. INlla16]
MVKRDFWDKVNKAWVSETNGINPKIPRIADRGTGMTTEEIKKQKEELKEQDNYDFSDF